MLSTTSPLKNFCNNKLITRERSRRDFGTRFTNASYVSLGKETPITTLRGRIGVVVVIEWAFSHNLCDMSRRFISFRINSLEAFSYFSSRFPQPVAKYLHRLSCRVVHKLVRVLLYLIKHFYTSFLEELRRVEFLLLTSHHQGLFRGEKS